jgi:hypothetical protein
LCSICFHFSTEMSILSNSTWTSVPPIWFPVLSSSYLPPIPPQDGCPRESTGSITASKEVRDSGKVLSRKQSGRATSSTKRCKRIFESVLLRSLAKEPPPPLPYPRNQGILYNSFLRSHRRFPNPHLCSKLPPLLNSPHRPHNSHSRLLLRTTVDKSLRLHPCVLPSPHKSSTSRLLPCIKCNFPVRLSSSRNLISGPLSHRRQFPPPSPGPPTWSNLPLIQCQVSFVRPAHPDNRSRTTSIVSKRKCLVFSSSWNPSPGSNPRPIGSGGSHLLTTSLLPSGLKFL